MNSIERFLATIERRPVDRPASWLGLPVKAAEAGLFRHFQVDSVNELKLKLGDDVFPVELPYHSPTSDAIYAAFDFAKSPGSIDDRTLTAPGFFEDISDPNLVESFDWPDPSHYIDPSECRRAVDAIPEGHPVLGVIWSAHFQDACAAFGMESALMKMVLEPEMFVTVIDRILQFYLKANEIFFEAVQGRLHAVLIGNDLGTQTGLIVSPDSVSKYVWPGTKRLVDQAHAYGLKVIHHSCGAIRDLIPGLIEIGVDAIHPIQALANNMEPHRLKADFSEQVAFCGGIDAQNLLVNGNIRQVEAKVRQLVDLFPTGLVVSPSHEAILPDIPPENVAAIFSALHQKELKQ